MSQKQQRYRRQNPAFLYVCSYIIFLMPARRYLLLHTPLYNREKYCYAETGQTNYPILSGYTQHKTVRVPDRLNGLRYFVACIIRPEIPASDARPEIIPDNFYRRRPVLPPHYHRIPARQGVLRFSVI